MSKMKRTITDYFQDTVKQHEYYNKNILEQLAKLQEVSAKLNKNIIRACTYCGCIEVNANNELYSYNREINLETIRLLDDHHIYGQLCDQCNDLVQENLGSSLYYLACICNSFNLDLNDILNKEMDKINLLGKFNIE